MLMESLFHFSCIFIWEFELLRGGYCYSLFFSFTFKFWPEYNGGPIGRFEITVHKRGHVRDKCLVAIKLYMLHGSIDDTKYAEW